MKSPPAGYATVQPQAAWLATLLRLWAAVLGFGAPLYQLPPLLTRLLHLQLKLNTDESPGVATEYGIRSIPTVMIFKNGQKLDTVIGAVPKSTLVSIIDKYL